jgi:hypothetical protein
MRSPLVFLPLALGASVLASGCSKNPVAQDAAQDGADGDVHSDTQTESNADHSPACYPLFHACTMTDECCAPNRCLNITGTLACQQEGPAMDAAGADGGGGSGGDGGLGGGGGNGGGGDGSLSDDAGTTPCGDGGACAGGQVCLRDVIGGASYGCPDAGQTNIPPNCEGRVLDMNGCCFGAETWIYSCRTRPSGCGATVTCACAASTLCGGGSCSELGASEISCLRAGT